MIIAMVLCLIKEQRSQLQSKRVSVTAPVIDICRPAHSNVDGDSGIAVPQRPREAFLPCKIASLVLLTLLMLGRLSPATLPRYPIGLQTI
jgi:hypothetical protein